MLLVGLYLQIQKLRRTPRTFIMLNSEISDFESTKKYKPVIQKLKLSKSLCKAAQDHATDLGTSGNLDHRGTDWSTIQERVSRYCTFDTWNEIFIHQDEVKDSNETSNVRIMLVDYGFYRAISKSKSL